MWTETRKDGKGPRTCAQSRLNLVPVSDQPSHRRPQSSDHALRAGRSHGQLQSNEPSAPVRGRLGDGNLENTRNGAASHWDSR